MIEKWLQTKLDITIEQLNEQSHKSFRESRPDQIGTEYDQPGGFCYKKWNVFVNSFQEGDEIWEFNSSTSSWRQLAGRAGFAIVRDSKVVASYVTMMS